MEPDQMEREQREDEPDRGEKEQQEVPQVDSGKTPDNGGESEVPPASDAEMEEKGDEKASGVPETDQPDEPPGSHTSPTKEDLDGGEMNEKKGDGSPAPDREIRAEEASHAEEREDGDEKEEEAAAAHSSKENDYEEQLKELQRLTAEEERARPYSAQLHMKLVEYFHSGATSERDFITVPYQEYLNNISLLTELKHRFVGKSEDIRRRADKLKVETEHKQFLVEAEWRSLMALKQEVALAVRHMNRDAARAKVRAIQTFEQQRQDTLIQMRIKHLKLKMKISRLKAEIQTAEDETSNANNKMEIQAIYSPEGKKKKEKQRRLSVKVYKEMKSTSQLLPKVKEKLEAMKVTVQANKVQLAELEARMLRQRDVLNGMRQLCNRLQKENLRLKDRCGLRGNRVLLLDFENTVNACQDLREKIETLKMGGTDVDLQSGESQET